MKTIEEILAQNPKDIINDLKKKNIKIPKWSVLQKQYDPLLHDIMDKAKYLDKVIKDNAGNVTKTVPVTRICIGLQKLAVKRISQLMFTIPVNSICDEADTDKAKGEQLNAVKKVLKTNKWNTLNKQRCKIISSQCESATYWYLVQESTNSSRYGFPSPFKLKSTVFSPEKGDALYPLFDEVGDMIAFSREYTLKDENDKSIKYFETWTDEYFYRWKENSGEWVLIGEPTPSPVNKIPVIYAYRPEPIWQDGDNGKVHEVELLLSRNGDIIAYHSAPVLLLKGKLKGAPDKGESNKVFETDADGGAEYVSWEQSPESTKFQFESLLRLFWTELQMPDISYENVKGIGASISGVTLEFMFSDAHLKCGEESEIYEALIEREYSVIKSYLGELNTKWRESIQELEIEPEIRPYIVNDEKGKVDVLIKANGGKPLVSQQQSVKLAGLSNNPEHDYITIQAEYTKENTFDALQPTI